MENKLNSAFCKIDDITKENILKMTVAFNMIENRNLSFPSRIKMVDNQKIEKYKREINNVFMEYSEHYSVDTFTMNYMIYQFDNDNKSKRLLDFVFENNASINGDSDTKEKYYLICYLVYRVRNNLFHGIKELSDINRNRDLFIICNDALNLILNMLNIYI